MKLTWKKSTGGTPLRRPMHYAVADGMRYEVTGCAHSFTARVWRLNKTRAPAMLVAYDDDRLQKCLDWCQRFEDGRALSQSRADKVRRRTPHVPRLKPRVLVRNANIG